MATTKAGPWIMGAVVLSLGILALAWFVLIAPQRDEAWAPRDEAETARQQNVIQAQRLATLEQQFADLDSYKAELAALRLQIPTDDGEPELLREIHTVAESAGLSVVNIGVGTPEEFFAAEPLEMPSDEPDTTEGEGATDEGAEDTAEGEAAAEGAEVAPAPTATEAAPCVPGFVAIPVQVTVVGTVDAARAFTEAMQTQIERLYMVTGFSMEGQEEAEASNGRPATAWGDVEMVLNGYVYVLKDSMTAAPADAAAATAGEQQS